MHYIKLNEIYGKKINGAKLIKFNYLLIKSSKFLNFKNKISANNHKLFLLVIVIIDYFLRYTSLYFSIRGKDNVSIAII